jgi:hypothetical protein
MIVAINVDPSNYRRIGEFVEKGRYESVESFVEIAVLNQILLETHGASSFGLRKESEISAKEESGNKQSQVRRQVNAQQPQQYLACPKDASIPVLPPLVLTKEIKSHPIWGQINRLAPAKIVLRMLANNVLLGIDRMDLKRFSADVAEAATTLRTFIEKKDKKNRIRGKELYIALPKKDPSSQQRFMSFYVGKLPSGKWTDGILTGLGLARIEQAEDGSTVIGLTASGRTLACLPSPLIDDFLLNGKQIEGPFSSSEVEFLLEQLQANRPGEFEYMVSVLRFIKDGADTPTSLRQKVGVFLRNRDPTMTISEKFVNTMLVGLMGRLVEMHLVEIEKDAQKSKYSVTAAGDVLTNLKVKA